ncbi:uncharacterized protein BP01DRAFT_360512 [Aspergillus saccharolyticus JOP 1030-1]|uniref:Zn(2)-C6 fungal-type domain-containing protein n=1 Tax=Aspergillus saccharolyticus JOP 1030-1 TaxID=1450539 RepID=A0A318Z265_9EURO|nr:hypothetical protein BP01DRAFT_360512 [Aspergillus saccharolyticus JOP 1030-1]PYH41381.1 hypothetical protein BP01DRAFT_360512 [Aspergillus saccharolyticus JOP 1030-1]
MLAETPSVLKTEQHSPGLGTGSLPTIDAPKLRAACENCRQSKVKCNLSGSAGGSEAPSSQSSSSSAAACIRCLRHGLTCRYRVANRSGKPKGSKNRATLRKLGQLQLQQHQQPREEQRQPVVTGEGRSSGGNPNPGWSYIESFVPSQAPSVHGMVKEASPQDTRQPSHSDSPDSQGVSMTDGSALMEDTPTSTQHIRYPQRHPPGLGGGLPPGCYVPPSPPPPPPPPLSMFDPTTTTATSSMSPTFLQKEFITKGLTSCPLAVHMQPTCDCGDALMFHMNRLRSVTTMVHHPRFDLVLQAIATGLATCRGFLQCPGCAKDGTHLLYAASIVDFTVQLLEYAIPYELSLASAAAAVATTSAAPATTSTTPTPSTTTDPSVLVGYGEYEIATDETRRIRRFLLRGRLLQCREVVSLLQETVEVSRQELLLSRGSPAGGPTELTAAFENGDLILQILAGHDATVEAFLQALSGEGCMCFGCC